MHLDELMIDIGDFGWYQIVIVSCLLSTMIPVAFTMLEMAFTGFIPDWWCDSMPTSDLVSNDNNHTTYLVTNSNISSHSISLNQCYGTGNATVCKREFDMSKRTIVNEWDLVCENRWISFTITTVQMSGALVGATIVSYTGDRFGRRRTLYVIQLLHLIFLGICAASQSWHLFTAMRFGIGLSAGATIVVCFPASIEFVGKKWRALLGAFPVWAGAAPFLPLITWLFPYWRHFEIIVCIISFPICLGFFIVPESIRWLTVKGKLKEAAAVACKIASKNKKPEPNTDILELVAEDERQINKTYSRYTHLDLFRDKRMALITLRVWYSWFTSAVCYWCLILGVQSMSGNFYLNFFLVSIVDIPASLLVLLFVNRKRFGRRWSIAMGNMGVALGALGAIIASLTAPPEHKAYYVSICAMISQFCTACGWSSMCVFTAELYPTVIRNLGYGSAGTSSRIGGVFASQVISLAVKGGYVPYVIICILMAIDTCSILTLPETRGEALEDTLNIEKKFNLRLSECKEVLQPVKESENQNV
ncbi:solute carrier family 22 member 21 isoform X1 [Patella vulgata]|uniref:solute carrier family 22 member 21 isoform X1 n=1 Tax=Patella vulgata TaxID=6465 RepID=UPI0021805412|nr:solute carrier family 22 member 21 isoform X1 [Patella vulgata]